MKNHKVSIIIIFCITGLLYSCIKDKFNFDNVAGGQYNPDVAAPLIHTKLTLSDLLGEYDSSNVITEDSNSFLTLIYRNTVYSKKADEFVDIPNQPINTNIIFTVPPGLGPGDSVIIPYSEDYYFTVNNDEILDSIFVKTNGISTMDFNLNSDINHYAKIEITIPSATKYGTPFKKIMPFDYTGTLPISQSFSLSGYKITFLDSNKIIINYDLIVYGDANPDNSPYFISMGDGIIDIQFSKVFGYLSQHFFDIDIDTVSLDIFKNKIEGIFNLEDPKVNIYVSNSFGFPISANFVQMGTHSDDNAPYDVSVSGSGIPAPWKINYPTVSEIGQKIETSLILNKTNSNIKDAINISPRYLFCKLTALSNPEGMIEQNFALDTSKLDVDIEVELPLYGRAWDFVNKDTLDFEIDDVDELESILFKLNINNGFPIDGKVQIYFTDTLYTVLDSLLSSFQQVIASAVPGGPPDYKVISPTNKTTTILFDKNRLNNIVNTKKMILKTKLATSDNGNTIVKIYSDYNMEIRLAARVQLSLDF